MEIRFEIDDAFVKDLQSKLDSKQLGRASEIRIMRDALALFKWAVDETNNGRIVMSSTPNGTDIKRVVMPALTVM